MALPSIEQASANINGVTVQCSHITCPEPANFRMEDVLEVVSGGYFTWQTVAKASQPRTIVVLVGNVEASFDLTTDWTKFIQVYEAVDPTSNRDVNIFFPAGEYWLYHTMLEKGNRVSDWSASPQDTEEQLAQIYVEIREQYTQIMSDTEQIILEAVSNYVKISDFETFKQENTAAIQVKADEILSTVSETYTTQETTESMQSVISQQAGQIASKVSQTDYNGNTIASLINQSADSVKIQANHIVLSGDVVLKSNLTDGTTQISGTNIKTGTIDASQVTVANIDASKITTGQIQASQINVSSINIDSAQITSGTINQARIPNLDASKITSGEIDARVVTVNHIDASNITAGNMNVSHLTGTIRDNGQTPSWTIDFDSGYMSIGNISANNINGGTMSANYISGGTINGNDVNITNLNASNISGGTIDANNVTITNLNASNIKAGTISDGSTNNDNYWNLSTGKLVARDGTIGGFTLANGTLYNGMTSISDRSHNGVYIGTDGIALGKGNLVLNSDGSATAKALNITGGSIAIDAGNAHTADETGNYISLSYGYSRYDTTYYRNSTFNSKALKISRYYEPSISVRNTWDAEYTEDGFTASYQQKNLVNQSILYRQDVKVKSDGILITCDGDNILKTECVKEDGTGSNKVTIGNATNCNVVLPGGSKTLFGSSTLDSYFNKSRLDVLFGSSSDISTNHVRLPGGDYVHIGSVTLQQYVDSRIPSIPSWSATNESSTNYSLKAKLDKLIKAKVDGSASATDPTYTVYQSQAYKYGELIIINFQISLNKDVSGDSTAAKAKRTFFIDLSGSAFTALRPLSTGMCALSSQSGGSAAVMFDSSTQELRFRFPSLSSGTHYYEGLFVYRSANTTALPSLFY